MEYNKISNLVSLIEIKQKPIHNSVSINAIFGSNNPHIFQPHVGVGPAPHEINLTITVKLVPKQNR